MAYDQALAQRVRDLVKGKQGISEKEMFGGICFMVNQNMFVGVSKEGLLARVGKERHAEMVQRKGARIMDFGGRQMAGFIYVDPAALKSAKDLCTWVEHCLEFAKTIKKKKK